ncbi:MAG: 4-phosphoerythronate dehydrogenase [Reinekea sp.]|jgi:erythronate-4-phosphate dehydrogenase
MTLRILADENMPNVEAWFAGSDARIDRKPGRTLTHADLQSADVLLVRSVTQVNAELLQNTPIKFVGSATIGTDHIDQTYLQSQNIPFHYAPGCNAQSVADWLLAVFARLHLDHDLHWWHKTIGIVGVGNVGSTVAKTLRKLGCRVLVCDPPKAERRELPEHISQAELLAQADIICFHTPHTRSGLYATHQMIGRDELALLKPGAWLINAGRGPVFQHQPLLAGALRQAFNLVLDVWPNEPFVDEPLLNAVALASPHVAGYSLEGKLTGTAMIAEAVYQWWQQQPLVRPALPQSITLDAGLFAQEDLKQWASELVLQVYDPARDTVVMRTSLSAGTIASAMFDQLRKQYPVRRELGSVKVNNAPEKLIPWLQALGFICA